LVRSLRAAMPKASWRSLSARCASANAADVENLLIDAHR
jgi:hypothetical protein